MPKTRILIVDDDHITRRSLSEFLHLEGYEVEVAECGTEALQKVEQNGFNVVLTDLSMPDVSGLEILKKIKAQEPETIVVIITGYGTIESAVESIKLGAYHYVTKPIVDEEIAMVISRALEQQDLKHENIILRQKLDMRFQFGNLVGHDYKMQQIYDTIETIADTRATVLITGESGTGKTMIARAIHFNSSRRKKPIIEVSCGALPESLLESELFGHVKGSFTGAVADKPGKFEMADGGTIFLDEISTASPALQVKLLRFLNDRVFERVGDTKTFSVD
ncbi:MAG: sigma-54-dependent Fis family transcriptional regulator, partial [Planctomycetes bacterium]|nr:sigma-54-dependent Fis family transcriptional regulator [Planctomycetota bacterium]